MKLEQRIDLFKYLGEYCTASGPGWEAAKKKAHAANGWFIPEFIDAAVTGIVTGFLQPDNLRAWTQKYHTPDQRPNPRTVGLVMAGNIPLVGFHDLLSVFISGHRQLVKPSGRDEILIRHLVEQLVEMDSNVAGYIGFAERLNGCDAYIATGGNNTARYFEYYFGKYPHVIRRNRTSVAVLTGDETTADLEALADDVNLYFGLGCRNVTQLLVPENYDFLRLLRAFRKYSYLADLAKYKHNYDYQLAMLILNKKYYMTNDSILLTENASPFSPISVLHYTYYRPQDGPPILAGPPDDIQCVVGQAKPTETSSAGTDTTGRSESCERDLARDKGEVPALPEFANFQAANSRHLYIPFGKAQQPGLTDYADGVDTMEFLSAL
jgi:acyl-CoA reductase LuxC